MYNQVFEIVTCNKCKEQSVFKITIKGQYMPYLCSHMVSKYGNFRTRFDKNFHGILSKKTHEECKAVSTGTLVLCTCVSGDNLEKQLASIFSYLLIGRLLVFEKSSPEYHPIQFLVA